MMAKFRIIDVGHENGMPMYQAQIRFMGLWFDCKDSTYGFPPNSWSFLDVDNYVTRRQRSMVNKARVIKEYP